MGHDFHVHVPCWQGREKIALIELFTVMGFDILITDVDAIWCATYPAVCTWTGCLLPPAAVTVSLFVTALPHLYAELMISKLARKRWASFRLHIS